MLGFELRKCKVADVSDPRKSPPKSFVVGKWNRRPETTKRWLEERHPENFYFIQVR